MGTTGEPTHGEEKPFLRMDTVAHSTIIGIFSFICIILA